MKSDCPSDIISKIADNIDAGITCFLNPETWEFEEIVQSVMDEYGPSDWDDNNDKLDEEDTGWQAELRQALLLQSEKIDSWKQCIRIEQPESCESYRFMVRFIENHIPENDIWFDRACQAVNSRCPFANFKHVIEHCSPYREKWFAFKRECLEEYVKEIIGIIQSEE